MSFKQLIDRNSALNADQARLAKLAGEAEVKAHRRTELVQDIENTAGNVNKLVDDLLAGGEGAGNAITVEALRAELDQVNFYLRALDAAIPKLRAKIQSQISDLAVEYAKSFANEQRARAHRTLDALLDLAEVSAEERAMRSAAEGEGCPGHYFPGFAFAIHGGALTGSFHTETLHLAALFEKYKGMGFAPTAAHLKRLAALQD